MVEMSQIRMTKQENDNTLFVEDLDSGIEITISLPGMSMEVNILNILEVLIDTTLTFKHAIGMNTETFAKIMADSIASAEVVQDIEKLNSLEDVLKMIEGFDQEEGQN